MKTFLLLSTLAFVSLFFAGCASRDTAESSTIAQTEIYQNYLVEYDKDVMTTTCTFRFGGPTGTTLSLTPPSYIFYNGISLTPSKDFLSGTVYRYSGYPYRSNASFDFRDTTGKAYQNTIDLAAVEFGNGPPASGSKGTKLVLPVTRKVPDQDTTIQLTITDAAGAGHSAQVQDGRGPESGPNLVYYDALQGGIVIEPGFLKDIPPGAVKIGMKTVKEQKVAQGTHLGGSIAVHYNAKQLPVTLNN